MRTTEQQQYDALVMVCQHVDYMPGWRFTAFDNGVLITWRSASSSNPSRDLSLSHFVQITDYRTDEAIIAKLFAACEYLALHEVKEWFTFQGHRVFGPHG